MNSLGRIGDATETAVTARIGFKRASIATAHKMVRVIQTMLHDKERLVVERNVARWIPKLKR